MSGDPLTPRHTDPFSSQLGLDRVKRTTANRLIVAVLAVHGNSWHKYTDTELTQIYYVSFGHEDRGHIARCRLNLERKGLFDRIEQPGLLHFFFNSGIANDYLYQRGKYGTDR